MSRSQHYAPATTETQLGPECKIKEIPGDLKLLSRANCHHNSAAAPQYSVGECMLCARRSRNKQSSESDRCSVKGQLGEQL